MVAEIFNFYDQAKQNEYKDECIYNEHLVSLSGQFLEIATSCLTKYGGDLIKFMGFSMCSIWPGYEEHKLSQRSHDDDNYMDDSPENIPTIKSDKNVT